LCLYSQEAIAQAISGPYAARAGHRAWSKLLCLLRLDEACQVRRGRDRDAGSGAAAMEGRTIRSGEIHLPGLRGNFASAGALPCAAARLCRGKPLGHDLVREVRSASTAQSSGRALHARRRGVEPFDARRPGWRLRRGSAPTL
jgi:hypothetical protein